MVTEKQTLARSGASPRVLVTERADRYPEARQQIEVCFSSLKRVVGLAATLVELATRIVDKITAYTPTLFGSTDACGGRKGRSKSCGHKPSNTHLVAF